MDKFVCVECGHLFVEPIWWHEEHGLSSPPYEKVWGSPCCYGNYVEAKKCSICNKYITGRYVKTEDGDRICERCYTEYELGEED